MPKTKMKSNITLHNLELPLHLGWLEAERSTPQPILLDIFIEFLSPPSACETDDLADTHCYDSLVKQIKTHVAQKHYRLLEHLGQEIYAFIQGLLPDNQISLRVKKQTQIPNLTGGVSFYYGDHQPAW